MPFPTFAYSRLLRRNEFSGSPVDCATGVEFQRLMNYLSTIVE
jgi:hypothetical protein